MSCHVRRRDDADSVPSETSDHFGRRRRGLERQRLHPPELIGTSPTVTRDRVGREQSAQWAARVGGRRRCRLGGGQRLSWKSGARGKERDEERECGHFSCSRSVSRLNSSVLERSVSRSFAVNVPEKADLRFGSLQRMPSARPSYWCCVGHANHRVVDRAERREPLHRAAARGVVMCRCTASFASPAVTAIVVGVLL